MKQVGLVCLIALGLARAAAAQPVSEPVPPSGPPVQGLPPTATFLEKRVPDELAADGVVLSRRDLGLQVEQVGARWLVSLIDLTTERVVASTKIDALPADREAAVATMTHVVSELVEQVVGHAERLPIAPTAPAPVAPAPVAPAPHVETPAERAERIARESAELAFRHQAIWFGPSYPSLSQDLENDEMRTWKAFQGKPNQQLTPIDFYKAVGRPDLVEAYDQRRLNSGAAFMLGGIAAISSVVVFAYEPADNCDVTSTTYARCEAGRGSTSSTKNVVAAVMLTGGLFGLGLGGYYLIQPQPITEHDAKQLADIYNQRLRGKLGLPVTRREPLLRDIRVAPRFSAGDHGLVLTARF